MGGHSACLPATDSFRLVREPPSLFHVAMGQKPVPPVNIPTPTKIGSKMVNSRTSQNGIPWVLTTAMCHHSSIPLGARGTARSSVGPDPQDAGASHPRGRTWPGAEASRSVIATCALLFGVGTPFYLAWWCCEGAPKWLRCYADWLLWVDMNRKDLLTFTTQMEPY